MTKFQIGSSYKHLQTTDKFVALPFTNRQISDSSKLKRFEDDNFKFDENSRKNSEREENTVGKGEIVRYEQFLLFPAVFSNDMYCRHVKSSVCLGKG